MKESTATRLGGRMPYEAPGLRLVPVAGVSAQLTISGSTTDFGNSDGSWGLVDIDGSTTTDFWNSGGSWGLAGIGGSTPTDFGNSQDGSWGLSSDGGATSDFTKSDGSW